MTTSNDETTVDARRRAQHYLENATQAVELSITLTTGEVLDLLRDVRLRVELAYVNVRALGVHEPAAPAPQRVELDTAKVELEALQRAYEQQTARVKDAEQRADDLLGTVESMGLVLARARELFGARVTDGESLLVLLDELAQREALRVGQTSAGAKADAIYGDLQKTRIILQEAIPEGPGQRFGQDLSALASVVAERAHQNARKAEAYDHFVSELAKLPVEYRPLFKEGGAPMVVLGWTANYVEMKVKEDYARSNSDPLVEENAGGVQFERIEAELHLTRDDIARAREAAEDASVGALGSRGGYRLPVLQLDEMPDVPGFDAFEVAVAHAHWTATRSAMPVNKLAAYPNFDESAREWCAGARHVLDILSAQRPLWESEAAKMLAAARKYLDAENRKPENANGRRAEPHVVALRYACAAAQTFRRMAGK